MASSQIAKSPREHDAGSNLVRPKKRGKAANLIAVFAMSLFTLAFGDTTLGRPDDSLPPLTYEQTSAIYSSMLQKIFKARGLNERETKTTEHLILTWIHVGPCRQPLTRDTSFAAASGNVQAANPDTPVGAAFLESVGLFMRENNGRVIDDFACRYAADRLKDSPTP